MDFLSFNGFELVPEEFHESTLKSLQRVVNGNIEKLPYGYFPILDEAGIDVWLNEEGKLHAMDGDTIIPTILFKNSEKPESIRNLVDIIFGPVAFARYDDEGNTVPLKAGDEELISKALNLEDIRFIGWGEQVRPTASVFINATVPDPVKEPPKQPWTTRD